MEGRQLRLMGFSNFTASHGVLREVDPSLEYARKMRLPIVQWVKRGEETSVEVLEPVELELKKHRGYAEEALRSYSVDSRLQFVRYGFVRVDSVDDGVYKVIYTHR